MRPHESARRSPRLVFRGVRVLSSRATGSSMGTRTQQLTAAELPRAFRRSNYPAPWFLYPTPLFLFGQQPTGRSSTMWCHRGWCFCTPVDFPFSFPHIFRNPSLRLLVSCPSPPLTAFIITVDSVPSSFLGQNLSCPSLSIESQRPQKRHHADPSRAATGSKTKISVLD